MIRQQRELLKRTFVIRELQSFSPAQLDGLAANQQEILTATQEFTDGIRERAGDVPPLNDAIADMQAASTALLAVALDYGQEMEESALANLIRARQNLRNILKQSDSSQASQCRSFDQQQQQKLRMPERERKPQDQQAEQLAQAREQLEQLAEQQQQWSQQACQTSSNSQSQQQMATEQQGAIDQAEQIRDQLQQSQRGGESTDEQMEQAAADMQQALDRLNADRSQEAADAAARAAERLEELAEHLDALNEPDFAKKLARAGNMAQQLADRQRELAKDLGAEGNATGQETQAEETAGQEPQRTVEETAERQRRLVEQAERLNELTADVAAESLEQAAEIQRMVQDARSANPPSEIVGLMREAAEDLERERSSRAVQSADVATRSLSQLAGDLRNAHQRLTQPDLEQLIAAEQQAAEMLREMLESRGESERAMARGKSDKLDQTLDPLAAGDKRLAEAQDAMHGRGNQDASAADSGGQRPSETLRQAVESNLSPEAQFNESDQVLVTGLRKVTSTLQTMIQEAILDRAMLAPDDAVPPGYEKMVEEYYRALSEDLR